MTQQQFEHWQQFSLAMVKGAYSHLTEKRQAKLRYEIERFFALDEIAQCYTGIHSYDESDKDVSYCVCDAVSEFFGERYGLDDWQRDGHKEYFVDQISLCIRSGIDVAAEPRVGVLGLTVGHVRRAFDGNVPQWVNVAFDGAFAAANDNDRIAL